MVVNPRALRTLPKANPAARDAAAPPPAGRAEGPPVPPSNMPTFDDFRHDPIALAWAKGRLGAGNWGEGYAWLVRGAGHPRRIGRQAGAALAAVERGEAAMTPTTAPRAPGRSTRGGAVS